MANERNLQSILNDLRNEFHSISIDQSKLIENVEQCIDQLIKKVHLAENFNQMKQMIDQLENLLKNVHFNEENLRETIECLQSNLNEIDQRKFPPVEEINCPSPSLSFSREDSSKEESYSYHFSLSSHRSLYPNLIEPMKKLSFSHENCFGLSSNDQHLIVIGKSQIYLFDFNLKKIKEKLFNKGKLIKDISWAKSLRRFLFISSNELFIFNDQTMIIKPLKLYFNENRNWNRIHSSEKCLFLSTYGENPFLIQFHLFPTILFFKKYQKPFISHQYQLINDINSNENSFLLIIEDHSMNQSFCNIYSLNSFQFLNKIYLGNGWNYRSLFFNQLCWIICDNYNNRFIYLHKDGSIIKSESYFPKPYRFLQLNQYQILIQTNQHFYLYQS